MSTPLTLGILSPLLGNFYFGQLLRGIQYVASQQGARTIAIQTRDAWARHAEYGRSRELTNQLAWEHVDGWIAITDAVEPAYLHALKQTGKPMVSLSWRFSDFDCPTVLPDNHGGVQQLVKHLIGHGHTRIGFTGFLEHTDIHERYEGYQATLIEHGLTPDPDLFFAAVDNQLAGGRSAGEQILAAGVPCTALVAGTDLNALAIIETLQAAGLRIPEDVAVVGFDDIDSAQYAVPALTTVRQRFDMIGRTGAELLLAKLAGAEVANGFHRVPSTLIVRRSCGCLPTAEISMAGSDVSGELNWREQLAAQLVQLALAPLPPPLDKPAAEIWPGVTFLIQGVAAAIDDSPGPSDQALAGAWQEAIALTTDLRALRAMITCLNAIAHSQLSTTDAEAHARLEQFLDAALSDMLHARLRVEIARSSHFETIIINNYDITSAILESEMDNARKLAWLQLTPASQACLGLWDSSHTQLIVAGVFSRVGEAPKLESIHPPQRFPPLELLQVPEQKTDAETLMLFPIRTTQHDWGFLAVVGPIEAALESGRSIFSQSTALLAIALEREGLLHSLVGQQTSLQEAYDRERILAETIREIGAPIIPLLPQVLLIPLIGTIDTARAQQLIEVALQGISAYQATEVLLDLTGVPLVDTQVAGGLIQVTRAATLLGAHVTLVGVRPEIAQSMVSLGIDLRSIGTQPTLSAAIELLLRRRSQSLERT
jgi:DNA-binding LacI/PurR family transcriptional regulator/anti-anti-sigma regulatory factor